jgi:hypothetical protein
MRDYKMPQIAEIWVTREIREICSVCRGRGDLVC